MVVLTQYVEPGGFDGIPDGVLQLTADERRHVRRTYTTALGEAIKLELARGSVLQPDSFVTTAAQDFWVQIIAQPQPVLKVSSRDPLALLRAAYHLGNRHVALQISTDGLQLEPDPVLKHLLVEHLDMEVTEQIAPFEPDPGAYHSHSH
ncbi:MAG: urease accessory protein UreE [Synechococcaceae cyanobacterium RM1_1_27]|nr:urease accessory protein UreE [Synechococcaceae cyanobacterium SM2_3_2]NJO85476.1 urease accessory protein UreE [Synechococcaceae cyanobacterium RM1_1_27]